jgi:UDP-4-amino-4,6-dideoxy-N-acetyl-beta-L-altrosamine N-acetyltransferase
MKISKYGITLERLTEADIEMVRRYRNAEEIKKIMQFRKHITRRMQKKWFNSVNNTSNFYFIIIYEGKKIGLVNIKNIDWNDTKAVSESGLFLWDANYVDSPAPLLASLILSEFGYGVLKGTISMIKTLKNNFKAIEFNKAIGYMPEGSQSNDDFEFYIQTKESFLERTRSLREKSLAFCGNDKNLYVQIEAHDFKNEFAQKFQEFISISGHKYIKQIQGDTESYSFLFDLS